MPPPIPNFSEFNPDLGIPTPSGFQSSMEKFLGVLKERGVTATLVSGERSRIQQQSIWNRRNPTTGLFKGNPVAPPGTSMHEMDLARDYKFNGPMSIDQIGTLAKQHGLKWGGDFKKRDPGHFQAADTIPSLSQSEGIEIPSFGEFEKTIPSFSEFDKETPSNVHISTKVDPKFGEGDVLEAANRELSEAVEKYFGPVVLRAFNKLPNATKEKIVQAVVTGSIPGQKRASGQLGPNPDANRTAMGLDIRYGLDMTPTQAVLVRARDDVLGEQAKGVYQRYLATLPAHRNPFLENNPFTHGPGKFTKRVAGLAMGGMAKAGGGIVSLIPGTGDAGFALGDSGQDLLDAVHAAMKENPIGGPKVLGEGLGDTATDVVGGVAQYAPLMLAPGASATASIFTKIGLLAAKGAAYSALEARGGRESGKGIAKAAAIGGAQFATLGVPLFGGAIAAPFKRLLARTASNLIITGGGTTLIHRVAGEPWDQSAKQGVIMSLLRAPELIKNVRVVTESGERPATVADIKGLQTESSIERRSPDRVPESDWLSYTDAERAAQRQEVESGQQDAPMARNGAVVDIHDNASRGTLPTGQEGSATTEAISQGVAAKVVKTINTIRTLRRTAPVRTVMSYTNGAGANEASVFAKQMKNDVGGLLRRTVGIPDRVGELLNKVRPTPTRTTTQAHRDALAFIVESQGNPAELDTMLNKITTSPDAAPGWVKRATVAINFARANYAQMTPAAARYSEIMQEQLMRERAAGLPTLEYPGYVMHGWDLADAQADWLERGGRGDGSSFEKVRVHPTFADGIAKGLNPKSLDALDLLESRVAKGQRLIQRREWVSSLRQTIDHTTQLPVVAEPIFTKRADGKMQPSAPKGYSLEYNGFEPIAVQKGYEGTYSALTDPSVFTKNAGLMGFQKANAFGKSIALMIDSFHLGRVAINQSMFKGFGGKIPLPSFKKGLTLLDATPHEIMEMAKKGEIPQEWTADLLNEVHKSDLMLKSGYNVGRITDALHSEWIRKIPGIGDFNRFLFDQYQRGAMREVWSMEYDRISKARPNLTDFERARVVTQDLNKAFGNLGKESWVKSATGQDIARALVLAPQWNEGLIRSELGGVKQIGEFVKDTAQSKRIYTGILMRKVGGLALATFAGNQLINMITRGHPTWQNKEEGLGAKLSAWIPDKLGGGPGFFLHPMGLAAETMHLFMQGFERTDNFGKTLDSYLRSRASYALRPLITYATSTDFLGRSLRPGTLWDALVGLMPFGPGGRGTRTGEAANQFIPAPIPWEPVKAALGGGQKFEGQFQKQLMSSVGVRTESVPSGEQRIRRLASAFNTAHGIERQGQFYESIYQPLSSALGGKNATGAVKDLLKQKSRGDIIKYYSNRITDPLTGKTDREVQFRKTLNAEQLQEYNTIREKRRQELQEVIRLLNSLPIP